MRFGFQTRLRGVQEVLNMTEVNVSENLTLLTRRSVKFKGKDEEISDVEIDRDRHGLHSRAWGPFLEAPGNYRAR